MLMTTGISAPPMDATRWKPSHMLNAVMLYLGQAPFFSRTMQLVLLLAYRLISLVVGSVLTQKIATSTVIAETVATLMACFPGILKDRWLTTSCSFAAAITGPGAFKTTRDWH